MKKVKITALAARLVEDWAKHVEGQIGLGYVPVVMWQVDDSARSEFTPQLTLGFEKREVVDRSRAMECEGREVEIYQYVPDELFREGSQRIVDRKNDHLILIEEP